MDDYRLMEVSGSAGGSKASAAYESIDNMGKEKEEDKESESSGLWGSESGSDDAYGHSENDSEDPIDPIWDLICKDDSDGLMELLNIPKDGSQNDPDYNYEQLKHAFKLSCYLNKLGCLKALLNCGVDWFAENAVGEDRLLQDACIAVSKNAAELVIAYAKEKKVADKLLGAAGGFTPLHVAALWGSCNVIQLLLDEGADPCKRDAKRKLPCDRAYPGTKARKLLVDAVLNKV